MIPPIDALNLKHTSDGELICLPTLDISGQDKPFLRPVEVQLSYSSDGVANLDEKFLPVGVKPQTFSSKYGILLRNHKNTESKPAWETINESSDAIIERCQKNRIKISFSVKHFCR